MLEKLELKWSLNVSCVIIELTTIVLVHGYRQKVRQHGHKNC